MPLRGSQKSELPRLPQLGALDVMPKPQATLATDQEKLKRTLITKIKVLATKTVAAKPLP